MKLAIVSDIHANAEALRATLAEISALAVNRIVCLGDIVGYNTDPAACITLLRQAGVPVSMVEVLDAFAALAHVELADRSQFRAALFATLVKRPEDQQAFTVLGHPGLKHFVRLCVHADGRVDAWAIGKDDMLSDSEPMLVDRFSWEPGPPVPRAPETPRGSRRPAPIDPPRT